MFYVLSKVGWFFATPSNLVASLILAGLAVALVPRLRRAGMALALISTVLLFVAGLSPLANLAIRPLENRFPTFQDDGRPVTGIVLLGGAVQTDESLRRGSLAVNEAADRVLALAALARAHPEARLLLSGGSGALFARGHPEAEVTAGFLEGLGIDRERMIVEGRSRTTYENAVESRALVTPAPGERWLLITSAWHMPRAVGVYRAAGFPVTAYPVDFRTDGETDHLTPFSSISDGLRRLDVASREWAGLVAYRLSGRTDAVFPAP